MGTLLSPSQECHPFTPPNLAHDLVVSPAIGSVAEKDYSENRHEVVAGRKLGVGPEIIRGFPEVGFELFDIVEGFVGHIDPTQSKLRGGRSRLSTIRLHLLTAPEFSPQATVYRYSSIQFDVTF